MPTHESAYYERKRRPVSEADLADAYFVNALLDVWAKNMAV